MPASTQAQKGGSCRDTIKYLFFAKQSPAKAFFSRYLSNLLPHLGAEIVFPTFI